MITTYFPDMATMMTVAVAVCIIVLMAMIVDLFSGLQKARQRNEVRSSWGLKRTMTKFITYEGGLMIALGVDMLIHISHLHQLLRIEHLQGVPFVMCMVGIFLLVVEFLSVREKADEKTKTEFSRVESLASKMVDKEELVDALTKAIVAASTQKGGNHE